MTILFESVFNTTLEKVEADEMEFLMLPYQEGIERALGEVGRTLYLCVAEPTML
jgi:hypothetical protein